MNNKITGKRIKPEITENVPADTEQVSFPNVEIRYHRAGDPEPSGKTVGGTIAKAIFNVNRYMTPYQAYKIIMGQCTGHIEPNIPMTMGNYLELPVMQMFCENQNLFLPVDSKKIQVIYSFSGIQHVKGRVSAHVDGWAMDEENNKVLIEVKNFSTYAHKGYTKISQEELVQIAHYQNILDTAYALLLVRVDNNLRVFKIERDAKLESDVSTSIENFLTEFVDKQVEPAVIAKDIDFLSDTLLPEVDNADLTETEILNMIQACEGYLRACDLIKTHTTEKDNYKARILKLLGNAQCFVNECVTVRKSQIPGRVTANISKIKEDDMLDKYTKVGEAYSRLTVKIQQ